MSINLNHLTLIWNKEKEQFTMTCDDDDTCRKIDVSLPNIRDIWGKLNSISVGYCDLYDYVYKRYVAAPVQNTETMVKIFLEMAETSMRELSPIQKETLLKIYEWGMNANHCVLHYSLEESLKYHLAEKIARKFSMYDRRNILSQYQNIGDEIAKRYYTLRGRSGMLYTPSTLKPRGW